jgi:ABC-type multidrug transport system ATPase subunit
MVTLKDLAAIGHAIAVVIHQPRISIFDLFLIILSYLKKGRVVYNGKANEAKSYLESYPCVQKLPSESGKADWLVDLITEDENRGGGCCPASLWEENCSQQTKTPQSVLDTSTRRLNHTALRSTPKTVFLLTLG